MGRNVDMIRRRLHLLALPCLVLLIAVGMGSCGGEKTEEVPQPDAPKSTAGDSAIEAMYSFYIRGEYDKYIDQIESNDDKPASYRKQTVMLLKQRHKQQEELHGGPKSCRVERIEQKTEDYRNVYLRLHFKDGASEQVLLPMVKVKGEWRFR